MQLYDYIYIGQTHTEIHSFPKIDLICHGTLIYGFFNTITMAYDYNNLVLKRVFCNYAEFCNTNFIINSDIHSNDSNLPVN